MLTTYSEPLESELAGAMKYQKPEPNEKQNKKTNQKM